MPEPFKNLFNTKMIAQMGAHIARVSAGFDQEKFGALAGDKLDALELKERSNQIKDALAATLQSDFVCACNQMSLALHPDEDRELGDITMDDQGIAGWAIMPMADFVAEAGQGHLDISFKTLGEFTKRFSSEFAIRAFFLSHPIETLQQAHTWALSQNQHVRRLASEGSRPRLPWGLRLGAYVEDPLPLIPLLEKLKDDPSEYVRRSVANNLNDIAKDHPNTVADIAAQWLKNASTNRTRLVKHACRSLIKSGHQPTLEALGYRAPQVKLNRLQLNQSHITLGETLEFEIDISSTSNDTQPLIIDFIIHHKRANGSTSPKTFKWKIMDLDAHKSVSLRKKHPIKPITTRVFYPGTHALEILINGEVLGRQEFELAV